MVWPKQMQCIYSTSKIWMLFRFSFRLSFTIVKGQTRVERVGFFCDVQHIHRPHPWVKRSHIIQMKTLRGFSKLTFWKRKGVDVDFGTVGSVEDLHTKFCYDLRRFWTAEQAKPIHYKIQGPIQPYKIQGYIVLGIYSWFYRLVIKIK